MTSPSLSVLIAALALAAGAVHAQGVEVRDAWVRATVPGQKASGAYMKLTARDNLRLVDVSSPAAGIAEVHEMRMEGDVMKMRAAPVVELPAGQTVEFKPGGYHVMLMDLRTALRPDSAVTLTLVLRNPQGVESRQTVRLPVRASAPDGAGAPHHPPH